MDANEPERTKVTFLAGEGRECLLTGDAKAFNELIMALSIAINEGESGLTAISHHGEEYRVSLVLLDDESIPPEAWPPMFVGFPEADNSDR